MRLSKGLSAGGVAVVVLGTASAFRSLQPVEPGPLGPHAAATAVAVAPAVSVPPPDHPYQFDRTWGGRLWGAHHKKGASSDGSEDELWIGMDGGGIRYSDDGGATWTAQETPRDVTDQIHGIFFHPDGLHGWAVAGRDGHGDLIKTDDGGTEWTYADDFEEKLFDVNFVTSSIGWICGDELLMKTTDGGASWDIDGFDTNDPYDATTSEFYALDSLVLNTSPTKWVAFVSAEPGVIMRRTQALPWKTVVHIDTCGDPQFNIPEGLTLPSDCSCDPLEMWDVSISPKNASGETPTAHAQVVVYAVGGVGNGLGGIFRSANGGFDWAREEHECTEACSSGLMDACPSSSPPEPDLTCITKGWGIFQSQYGIQAIDATHAISCGYGGGMYTRDPGTEPALWIERTNRCEQGTGPLQTVVGDGQNAWVFGFFGAVRRTDDGGETWDESRGHEHSRWNDIDFVDSSAGWAVGEENRIAYSSDGGITWDEQYSVPSCIDLGDLDNRGSALRGIAMADELNGVAVGQPQCPANCAATCYATRCVDGESTMVSVNCCEQTGNGACKKLPLVLYNFAAGTNEWELADLPDAIAGNGLLAVAYSGNNGPDVDPDPDNEFWAVGFGGAVLHSTDSGQSWSLDSSAIGVIPTDATLRGVAFDDLDVGYVVGFRYSSGVQIPLAYRRESGAWTSAMPSNTTGFGFYDVDVRNGDAIAVGYASPGSEGHVWLCMNESSTFSFELDACEMVYPCKLLSAAVTPDGQFFVGGVDGILLWRDTLGDWYVGDSEMGENIVAMSFVSDDEGFLAGFGDDAGTHGDSSVSRYGQ